MTQQPTPIIGLACAGGGIEGAIYEIGALCALDEALEGTQVNQFDVYVGVSAGALVTSCLANGISPHVMSRAIISEADDPDLNIRPEILFTPALREYAKRLGKTPATVAKALWTYFRNPFDRSPVGALADLGSAVPVGLFDNAPLDTHLAKSFAKKGRTNDFRELAAQLRIIAVNVDTAAVVPFGTAQTAHVPISKAVQASTALPGLYLPVEIDGANYIDGVARRTVHASVALDEGVDLLFCINPLVPVHHKVEGDTDPSLVQDGLLKVMSQTFRTLVYSRMRTGFRSYEHLYPDADTVLIEPTPEEYREIFTNLFSFSNRHAVCEIAYQATRRQLREHADEIAPVLARHGLQLRRDVLDAPRTLYDQPEQPTTQDVLDETNRTLDQLEQLLQRVASRYS